MENIAGLIREETTRHPEIPSKKIGAMVAEAYAETLHEFKGNRTAIGRALSMASMSALPFMRALPPAILPAVFAAGAVASVAGPAIDLSGRIIAQREVNRQIGQGHHHFKEDAPASRFYRPTRELLTKEFGLT
ncbi:MAG TPA: hypothetical protein VHB73_03525 [Alphaproteobacteria bacterium]|nr:hypothetical protein [Alphaproteobacteria bacterium]